MKCNTKRFFNLFFLYICFFLFSASVKAGSASLSLNGSNSVYVGKNVEITVALNNINVNDGVMGVEFKVDYDASALEFVSASNMASFMVGYEDKVKTIAGVSFSSATHIKSKSANIIKLIFKTKKEGNTVFKITQAEVTEGNNDIASVGTTSKTISVTPPPSKNANLSGITLSSGSLKFSPSTTSYQVSVDSSVTSINVGATCEDAGAKVTGGGIKSLNYGNNTINLVVTAPSGDKKTYTIIVNRVDNRSNINTLKSLSVADYNLSPSFNANTTNYNISVPFSVSSINVSAAPTDEKASVKISGNTKLAAGKTTKITILVTAENGTTKTYTIKAKRDPDPNKVLATDNNLASLVVSGYAISPKFNKETLDYTLTVPTEIEEIKIDAKPADKEYGDVDISGPETLKIGENKYQIKVTAEDGSTKTYTIVVTREGNPEENLSKEPEIVKTFDLKSITITNGSLKEKFDKDIHIYHYKSKGDIQIEALVEDENNKVTVLEEDGVYSILVENEEGEISIYTLIPTEGNMHLIIEIGISILLIIVSYILGYKKRNNKSLFSKDKKESNKNRK